MEKGVLLEIEDLPVSQYVPLPLGGRAVAAQSSGTGREVAGVRRSRGHPRDGESCSGHLWDGAGGGFGVWIRP